VRREFNMIAVWSSDRLGRSLKHLVEVLEIIRETGTGLYIHTQSVDTTTPAGRAMFGMLGIFSEFEREMIVARVNAGLARARDAIERDGHFISKAGKKHKRFGRPNADPKKLEKARQELANGTGVLKTAKLVGLGTGTVQRLKEADEPPQRLNRAGSGARHPRSGEPPPTTATRPAASPTTACWCR